MYSLATLEWKNGNALDNGGVLHEGNLYKKFRMLDGIAFGANIDIGINVGTGGLIRAPVGPEGTYTDIPAGCIAFKVNKTSEEAQKIRVIIAVPKSDYFPGEDGYDLGDYTRYFCMWSMPENTGEGSSIFRAQDYIERFEIPRSHYYDASSATPDGSEHVTVTYNGNQNYRVYLNAERLLVAYEFKVYNEGVYVLGTSTSTSDSGNIFGEKDSSPMEIVYFSADGVASSGRDGESGSQLGTIDYVYSYDKNIVPVEERSSTNDEGNEDYSTYYPSYCMLYMNSLMGDGSLVNINSEKVYIRRYVIGEDDTPTSSGDFLTTPSRSTIAFKLEADKHSRLIQYSRLADNVIQEE